MPAAAPGGRGPIDIDERLAAQAKQFERLDANGDGSLSVEEYAGAAALHEMDADKDGIIEREEYNAHKEAKKSARQAAKQSAKSEG